MFTAPLFQQVPDATLDQLRKFRDAQLAVRAWRYKQEKRRQKESKRTVSR